MMMRQRSFFLGCCLYYLLFLQLVTASTPTATAAEEQERKLKGSQGEEEVQNRVVGGDPVPSITKYPFFLEWEDAKCGASLIHDDVRFFFCRYCVMVFVPSIHSQFSF